MTDGTTWLERYARQVALPGVGASGQRRLAESGVLVVGCGALGSVSAELLARGGVGQLTVVDRDVVDWTNLHRQGMYGERDAAAGVPKAHAAAQRLREINSSVHVEAFAVDLTSRNVERVLTAGGRVDVIVDGTDNFETRYLLNDVAVRSGLPYVFGSALGVRGQVAVLAAGGGPCLRCLCDRLPAAGSQPTCESAGVLGPVAWVVGALQAAEAMRLLLHPGAEASSLLLDIELWPWRIRTVDLAGARQSGCVCCGQRRFEYLASRSGSATVTLCGANAVQVSPADGGRVDLSALARRLSAVGTFSAGPDLLRGVIRGGASGCGRELELIVFADGRAIVRGTDRPEVARSVYARYVGV